MNKKFAIIGVALLTFLSTIPAFAQYGKFRGTVKYKIEWKGEVPAQAPTTYEVKVWENSCGMQDLSFPLATTLTNASIPIMWTLIDFSMIPVEGVQGKWYIRTSKEDFAKVQEKIKYTYSGEKKEIAGIPCEKVHVALQEGEGAVEEEDIWASVDFGPQTDMEHYPGLRGMPFQYSMDFTETLSATLTVEEVIEGNIKETDILLPTDYEEITQDDFMDMMSTLQEAMGGGDDDI